MFAYVISSLPFLVVPHKVQIISDNADSRRDLVLGQGGFLFEGPLVGEGIDESNQEPPFRGGSFAWLDGEVSCTDGADPHGALLRCIPSPTYSGLTFGESQQRPAWT